MKLKISFLPRFAFTLFAGLLAVALIRHYSDVPYWDMWDGYLDFYHKVLQGDLSAWWGQHNEHRIILSRLLFWMDLAWFGGKSAFLITINFMLAVSSALLMGGIFREMFRGQAYTVGHYLLYTLCLIMPLSWIQEKNLSWAFQSQFFLAQLLPLAAFYCFYLSEKKSNKIWFSASLALGIASAGTMANGVVALPILAVIALLAAEARFRKALMYGIAAALVLALYFLDYQSPPRGHGPLADILLEQPLGILKYTALYIGSPIYFLLDKIAPGSWDKLILYFSMVSGFSLIIGSLLITVTVLKRPRAYVLEIALLGFIVYVGATAFGTAGGRLMFGLEQALSGRYRTPAILLWLCFLILFFGMHPGVFKRKYARAISVFGLLVAFCLLFYFQISGVVSHNQRAEFEKNMAVLAISLGIQDASQIRHVYPSAKTVIRTTQKSVASEVSIFGEEQRFYKLQRQMGKISPVDVENARGCRGHIDQIAPVVGDSKYLKMRGWLFERNADLNVPYKVALANGKSIGYLILGKERPDVANAVDKSALYAGFKGYVLRKNLKHTGRIFISYAGNACWLNVDVPIHPFSISPQKWKGVSLTESDIVNNNGWNGSDYQRTNKDGFLILGSYVDSDRDTGELEFNVKDGDSFMIKTGPDNGGQFLKIEGPDGKDFPIPQSGQWVLMTIDLGEDEDKKNTNYQISLVDRGGEWGQWSAIAVLD